MLAWAGELAPQRRREDELSILLATASAWQAERAPGEPYFIIGDYRKALGVTLGARKVIANNPLLRQSAHVAIFGAPLRYEEAEARAWLMEQRRAFLARRQPE
ncbi:MAG TPA: hypothetical protein VM580_28610 [Labilithrix sp.]|nr:hypothetical protein [Labilithrix sp.]